MLSQKHFTLNKEEEADEVLTRDNTKEVNVRRIGVIFVKREVTLLPTAGAKSEHENRMTATIVEKKVMRRMTVQSGGRDKPFEIVEETNAINEETDVTKEEMDMTKEGTDATKEETDVTKEGTDATKEETCHGVGLDARKVCLERRDVRKVGL